MWSGRHDNFPNGKPPNDKCTGFHWWVGLYFGVRSKCHHIVLLIFFSHNSHLAFWLLANCRDFNQDAVATSDKIPNDNVKRWCTVALLCFILGLCFRSLTIRDILIYNWKKHLIEFCICLLSANEALSTTRWQYQSQV